MDPSTPGLDLFTSHHVQVRPSEVNYRKDFVLYAGEQQFRKVVWHSGIDLTMSADRSTEVIRQELFFMKAVLSDDLYQTLVNNKDAVKENNFLRFLHCLISKPTGPFLEIISTMNLTMICFEGCHGTETFVTDEVMKCLPALEMLIIQPEQPCHLLSFTNDTASLFQERNITPRNIIWNNKTSSGLTVKGVGMMMKIALPILEEDPATQINWSFGFLNPLDSDKFLLPLFLHQGIHVDVSEEANAAHFKISGDRLKVEFLLPRPLSAFSISEQNSEEQQVKSEIPLQNVP